ncbi:MAG: STAS domain-containing protein [Halocynthiibacter sp.]
MNLQAETVNGVLVVTTSENRIDAAIAIQFKDKMRELTEFCPDRIVLDLSSVDFLDSSGLGAVVAAMKQLSSGKTLELAGLTNTVNKVFRLTRMDSVFTIHASAALAIGQAHAS